MPDDTLIPRLQFAADLGVPVSAVDRWRSRGCYGVKLQPTLVGDRVRYSMAAYRAWQEEVRTARARSRARKMERPAPRATKRQLEAVEARLRRMGMKV